MSLFDFNGSPFTWSPTGGWNYNSSKWLDPLAEAKKKKDWWNKHRSADDPYNISDLQNTYAQNNSLIGVTKIQEETGNRFNQVLGLLDHNLSADRDMYVDFNASPGIEYQRLLGQQTNYNNLSDEDKSKVLAPDLSKYANIATDLWSGLDGSKWSKFLSKEGMTKDDGSLSNAGKAAKGAGIAGQVMGTLAKLSPWDADKDHNSVDSTAKQIRETGANVMMSSGNPWLSLAGGAILLGGKAGAFTDGSKGLGTGNDILNAWSAISLPGLGWLSGKTDKAIKFDDVASSKSMTGTMENYNKVSQNANAKILFGSGKANKQIREANRQMNLGHQILDKAREDIAMAWNPHYQTQYEWDLHGGAEGRIWARKQGGQLQDAKRILKKRKERYMVVTPPDVQTMRDGGELKPRTTDELIELMKQSKGRDFVRMAEPMKSINFIDKNGNQAWGTHYMACDKLIVNGKTRYYVYPTIQEMSDGSLQYLGNKAFDRALETNNVIEVNSPDEAERLSRFYKQGYPEFFKEYETAIFKQGGTFNVIPEGALHKNKHHLTDVDDRFKEVTTKGIPVVSESEGGEMVQHAEVEKEEIIFRLEVTKKLEELAKENTDEAAIEAGKLLCDEILRNTKDNTKTMI